MKSERSIYQVTSLVVSIKRTEGVTFPEPNPVHHPETLSLSFPLSVYTTAPAPHVAALQSRLSATRALPSTWVLAEQVSTGIVLYRLTCQPVVLTPDLRFSLTIDKDFSWTLCVSSSIVPPQSCPVLTSMPSALTSVAEVAGLLHIVKSSTICTGNSDEKFMELATRRGGIFKNRSGKIWA